MIRLSCILFAFLWISIHDAVAATYTVTSTNDSNASGTLRWAIQSANTSAVHDTVTFSIVGASPFTITITGSLPEVSFPLSIDGSTQSGYTGEPLIHVDGAAIPYAVDTTIFKLSAPSSSVKALRLFNSRFMGILIDSNESTRIEGCHIVSNLVGIYVRNSRSCYLGGTNGVFTRNVIGFNSAQGIYIENAYSNSILGNYIGVDGTGTLSNKNAVGVILDSSASNNIIGGISSSERNIISGNGNGLNLGGAHNIALGNYIGTTPDGNYALANDGTGINVLGPRNIIGSPQAGNLISGNTGSGLSIKSHDALVQNNMIGLAVNGLDALGNQGDGIVITGTGTYNSVIGGTNSSERNIISANSGEGIYFGSQAHNNTILGNYIGLDSSGLLNRGNTGDGIDIIGASHNNIIGGTDASGRNYIAGNGWYGVSIRENSSNNVVIGNYIGTDITGMNVMSNSLGCVLIRDGSHNFIGNETLGAGNILVGGANGVDIRESSSDGNVVQGNNIGLLADGMSKVPMTRGVRIYNSANNSIIGGYTTNGVNYITGMTIEGIDVATDVAGSLILGNVIGIDRTGTNVLGNGTGISIGGYNNNIGSSTNVVPILIGGNGKGLDIYNASNCSVMGVFAGVNSVGTTLANSNFGILVQNSYDIYIGSPTSALPTIISGNLKNGLEIKTSTNVFVHNCIIGTDESKTLNLGNKKAGIYIDSGVSNVVVGGTNENYANTIAFNLTNGVTVAAVDSRGVSVRGNTIISNGLIGIDLGNDGITANDFRDPDTGPNNLQNYPAVTNVYRVGTFIQGNYTFVSGLVCSLDFYLSDTSNREGRVFIGSTNVVHTSTALRQSFEVLLPYTAATSKWLTATATDTNGNTSEFSTPVSVQMPPTTDTDGDGMPDYWEVIHFGGLGENETGDYDLDGDSNLGEYVADTDPTDATSYIQVDRISSSNNVAFVVLDYSSAARFYDLETAGSLTSSWISSTVTNVQGSDSSLFLTNAISTMQFFRVKAKLP